MTPIVNPVTTLFAEVNSSLAVDDQERADENLDFL
jgi:hypothetical protein